MEENDKIREIPSIKGGLTKTEDNLPDLTGDDLLDSLITQVLQSLESDKRETDELYEYIRDLAEGKADDASMQKAAIDALKLRTASTDKAVRLVELIGRIRLAKERRLPPAKEEKPGAELVNIIGQINRSDDKKAEGE